MNSFNIHKEYHLIKHLVILGWLSCWFSIGFNPEFFNQLEKFRELSFENHNYQYLILFLRGIGNLVFFPILSFILLKLITQNHIILKLEFFFLAFSILFFIQATGLVLSENPNINMYYVISSLNIIMICLIIKNYFLKNELILIFNITFVILASILVVYGVIYLYEFSIGINQTLYNSWGNIQSNYKFNEIPRPTGLSRTALIILIILSLLSKERKIYKLNTILIPICSFFILSLGSRTILLLFFVYIIFYFFYKRKKNLKDIFFDLCKLLFFPILIILLINVSNNKLINKVETGLNLETENKKNLIRSYPKLEISKLDVFSSNRINDWKSILKKNKSYIYGNGALGDRYLIKQSASNLIIYTYASSGILGLIIIIYIYLKTIIFFLTNLIKTNDYYLKDYKLISSFCLVVLIGRSILETSFGIFGIDLALFCFFVTIITFKNGK